MLRPGIRRGLLCLACGGLTVLAFAPYNLFPVPFLTLAILFRAWRAGNAKQAFFNGYLYGLGLFGFGVSWLHVSIHLYAGVNAVGAWALTLLLVAYLALFPALVGYLGSRLAVRSDGRYFLLVMPSLWTLGEWVRSWLFSGFPWLSLGYTQTSTPLSGFAVLAGTFGVGFLVAFLAGACAAGVRPGRRLAAASTLAAALAAGWGLGQRQWSEPIAAEVDAALVQGGIPQRLKWLPGHRRVSLERYQAITEPFWGRDLIIWPETAIPAYLHRSREFIDSLEAAARAHGSVLLLGLPTKNLDSGAHFNSLLLVGAERQVYNKRRLVPFGEYLPLRPLLGRLVEALDIPMSDFSPGARDIPPLFHARGFSMGISICYEAVFGADIIKALPAANVLVNVSNDAWFGDSLAPHQHLQMARMRAVETGRYLLRATNTGISALIDEKGKTVGKTRQFEADAVAARIELFAGATPYVRAGDGPVVALALLLLLLSRLRGGAWGRRAAAGD